METLNMNRVLFMQNQFNDRAFCHPSSHPWKPPVPKQNVQFESHFSLPPSHLMNIDNFTMAYLRILARI